MANQLGKTHQAIHDLRAVLHDHLIGHLGVEAPSFETLPPCPLCAEEPDPEAPIPEFMKIEATWAEVEMTFYGKYHVQRVLLEPAQARAIARNLSEAADDAERASSDEGHSPVTPPRDDTQHDS